MLKTETLWTAGARRDRGNIGMLVYSFSALETDDDRQFMTSLVEEYEAKMYHIAKQFRLSHADIEDVVSESFVKIIQNFEKCRSLTRNEREGWIVIIVKNTALDLYRRNKRVDWLEDREEPAAEADMDSEVAYGNLVETIRNMPENYREIMELKYVYEWSNIEIAQHLGMSESVVGARLFRAREKLKRQLKQEGSHQ